jgi:hypothetical protein
MHRLSCRDSTHRWNSTLLGRARQEPSSSVAAGPSAVRLRSRLRSSDRRGPAPATTPPRPQAPGPRLRRSDCGGNGKDRQPRVSGAGPEVRAFHARRWRRPRSTTRVQRLRPDHSQMASPFCRTNKWTDITGAHPALTSPSLVYCAIPPSRTSKPCQAGSVGYFPAALSHHQGFSRCDSSPATKSSLTFSLRLLR